jgi:hypothetical protein
MIAPLLALQLPSLSSLLPGLPELIYQFSATCWLGTAAPLAGRIAFAAVFALLIAWLIWIPAERLQDGTNADGTRSGPSTTAVRVAAIAIAALQVALYLLWR